MVISVARAQDFFLVLTRTLAVVSAVPVLGGRAIPARVRVGLGLLLAAAIFPWSPAPPGDAYEPLLPFLWNVARELVAGLLAGMAVRLAFAALESAATLMSQSAGFSAGAILNPAFELTGAAFDQFYGLAALLVFLVTDGHHQLLRGLARTFQQVPLRALALDPVGQERLARLSAGMFVSAVQMALPVLATMILLDLALGLLARVSPQVNVFFLGAPLKIGVSLLALAAVLPLLAPLMATLFAQTAAQMNPLATGR